MIKILKIDVVNKEATKNLRELFFIAIVVSDNNKLDWDFLVADYLDLKLEEYVKILKKYGAELVADERDGSFYYFKNKSDAEKCLVELEPIYIMAKLME